MDQTDRVILNYLEEQPRTTTEILLFLCRRQDEEYFNFEIVDKRMKILYSKLKVCILENDNGNRTWGLFGELPSDEENDSSPLVESHWVPVNLIRSSINRNPVELKVVREESKEVRLKKEILLVIAKLEEQVHHMVDISPEARSQVRQYLQQLKTTEPEN